ncbi:hypothetical protein MRX96_039665 [Rhipicephalus microplus]
MGHRFPDGMMFVEDAVASLSVPWKWDILHRWKHADWLRNRRHHPATAALLEDKGAAGEQHCFNDRMFLVYDRDLCTKEEDDPSDAIVFFHPANMALEQKCDLSCQLVGVVHFFNSCFDTPRAIELKENKVAVRVLDNYIVLLTWDVKLGNLIRLITLLFDRRSLEEPKNLSNYVLQQQMDLFVRLLRFYHKGLADMKEVYRLSNLFQAVPTLNLPEAASHVYAKGYTHLEELQKMPGVLASCVVFDERVLASQFTPEITQLLLLAATSKERLAMQDVHEQTACQDDDGTHRLQAMEKEPERADSLSDVDSALSSQTTNHSSTCAPLASTILQLTGKRSLPDSDFLSDFDSAEDASDGAGPDACLRRLAELQYTVADCLRISEENLAADGRRKRRTSSRSSRRNLRKYVSRPDLNRVLNDIDEVQGQEYASTTVTPYRHDVDVNVFQDYDAGMGFDAAGLFYQAQTMQAPLLHQPPQEPAGERHCYDVTEGGRDVRKWPLEKKSLLSALRKTCLRPPEPKATTRSDQGVPRQNALNSFDLPPVIQVELGEALDVPVEKSNQTFRKHKDDNGGSLRFSSMPAQERPKSENERVRSAEDIDRCTVLSDDDERTYAGCELIRTTLFVQRYCNMACLVLLADAAEENEAFIHSLWRRCIAELGDLEVAARSWQHRDTESANATVCAEVCYNSKLRSVTGSLPTLAEQAKWCLQSIQCAHEEFLRSTCVNNINALSHGNTWIQATRSEDHESFKVTTDDPKHLSAANVA